MHVVEDENLSSIAIGHIVRRAYLKLAVSPLFDLFTDELGDHHHDDDESGCYRDDDDKSWY